MLTCRAIRPRRQALHTPPFFFPHQYTQLCSVTLPIRMPLLSCKRIFHSSCVNLDFPSIPWRRFFCFISNFTIQIGWYTLTPFLAQIAGKAFVGVAVDYCSGKGIITLTNGTKIAQSMGENSFFLPLKLKHWRILRCFDYADLPFTPAKLWQSEYLLLHPTVIWFDFLRSCWNFITLSGLLLSGVNSTYLLIGGADKRGWW